MFTFSRHVWHLRSRSTDTDSVIHFVQCSLQQEIIPVYSVINVNVSVFNIKIRNSKFTQYKIGPTTLFLFCTSNPVLYSAATFRIKPSHVIKRILSVVLRPICDSWLCYRQIHQFNAQLRS